MTTVTCKPVLVDGKPVVYEQGDVVLYALESVQYQPKSWDSATAPARFGDAQSACVMAHGENGHTHLMTCAEGVRKLEQPDSFRWPESLDIAMPIDNVVDVLGVARLTHEEHGHFDVPAGLYAKGIVREYDYATHMASRVRD